MNRAEMAVAFGAGVLAPSVTFISRRIFSAGRLASSSSKYARRFPEVQAEPREAAQRTKAKVSEPRPDITQAPSLQLRPLARILTPLSASGLRINAAGVVPHPGSQLGIARGHGGRAASGGRQEPWPRRYRMVEKHYGHLAPSYIADAIRAGAPRFGDTPRYDCPAALRQAGGIVK